MGLRVLKMKNVEYYHSGKIRIYLYLIVNASWVIVSASSCSDAMIVVWVI